MRYANQFVPFRSYLILLSSTLVPRKFKFSRKGTNCFETLERRNAFRRVTYERPRKIRKEREPKMRPPTIARIFQPLHPCLEDELSRGGDTRGGEVNLPCIHGNGAKRIVQLRGTHSRRRFPPGISSRGRHVV